MEELVSLLRVYRRKKDLRDPKNAHCKREKKRKISSCGSGRKKKPCQTRKSRKNGSGRIDFHESDPNRRKTNLHNAKKYAIAGLREKKSRVRPAPLLCRQGRPQKYLKNRFVGIEKAVKKFAWQVNKFRRIGHTSAIRQRQEQQAGTTGRNERLRQKAGAKS